MITYDDMISYDDAISAQQRLLEGRHEPVSEDDPRYIQEKIYNDLSKQIRLGVLPPGKKLSENGLAVFYKCSRTPVREALQSLARDGYLIIQPKSGTYVRMHTLKESKDSNQVRAYLEACGFSVIISKKEEVNLEPMQNIFDQLEEVRKTRPFNLEKFGVLHVQFHSQLVNLSGNDVLIELYNKLHLMTVEKLFFRPMTQEDLELTQEEHAKILKYLREKDEKGVEFIIRHLLK